MATLSTPKTAEPLSDFERIADHTYLFTPGDYTSSEPLVLFFSWMGAAPKHIAKYMVAYRKIFPRARICLIRNELADFFRSEATYNKVLAPAFSIATEHVHAGGQLLVHSFSHGGANQMIQIAKMWVTRKGSPLPMRAQMIDSAPGNMEWRRSHKAISSALPNFWLWSAAVHLFLVAIFIVTKLSGREPVIPTMRRQLNDASLFDSKAPRVYVYSKADEMIGWDEVEKHADLAEAQGWKVTRIRFEKSAHVGHIREDQGRYWSAMQKAWAEGGRLQAEIQM